MAERKVAIVGTGFVADLYAASLETFPDIEVVACYDRDRDRLERFCSHWKLPLAPDLETLIATRATIVINLTNPHSHYAISRAALDAGRHVYSEKPLATNMDDARTLHAVAKARGLELASAPCSMLSEAAQTVRRAVQDGVIGPPRLVYAELDDDFLSQAPVHLWRSESGAPWPVRDELRVGCTLEHAGYYLTWLMAMFGRIHTVCAASAQVTDTSHLTQDPVAPDYSSATLFFDDGPVTRLTCSIVAPHDHRLRIFGDKGVLHVDECWNNVAAVKVRRRYVIRRRLVTSPVARRLKPEGWMRHPLVKWRGAAAMNFMLGPAEMLDAIEAGQPSRLGGDFALHLTEVSLAIQGSGRNTGVQRMTSEFKRPDPVRWEHA